MHAVDPIATTYLPQLMGKGEILSPSLQGGTLEIDKLILIQSKVIYRTYDPILPADTRT